MYTAQAAWAAGTTHPPLLWSFGVSLVERALIDGYCRATQQPFADAVRQNTLGIDLGAIHAELAGSQPAQWLPAKPTERLLVRHTVGLGDPLDHSDLSHSQRVNDGLPETLVECIESYGLTHFKIKLGGTPEQDVARLSRIARLLEDTVAGEYVVTLDGNEQYRSMADLQQFWRAVEEADSLHKFRGHIAFVEQPLHRDATLSDEVGDALAAWDQHPPLLIDESDGSLDSLPRALALGYCGTSHKNCKGVFKSIANRSLIAHRQQLEPTGRLIMSAEDLSTVGPVALLQDLATIATLGLTHAERNGHHYFRGLEMWLPVVGEMMLAHHGDLYTQRAIESPSHPQATPTLDIRGGSISLASVLNAPYGLGVELPFEQLMGGEEVFKQFGLEAGATQ
jgi:hypothetical protein